MQKRCEGPSCSVVFEAKRSAAKYHSDTCRKRAQRKPQLQVVSSQDASDVALPAGGVYERALAELETAGRVESSSGQLALVYARRLDSPRSETGAGLRALGEGFRATMAEALQAAASEDEPLQRIRRAAAMKLLAGGVSG